MTNFKFIPQTEELQEMVIWVDDLEAAVREFGLDEALENTMDQVFTGDLKCRGAIHVIDDNKQLAENMANALNVKYKEVKKLLADAKKAQKEARKEVDEMVENKEVVSKEEVSKEEEVVLNSNEALRSKSAAKKFLQEQSAALIAAKQAPKKLAEANKENTKEEKTMNTTTTGGRRRMNTGATTTNQEVTNVNTTQTNEKEVANVENNQTQGRTGRRQSTGGTTQTTVKANTSTTRKRLGRSESMRGSGFQKHEGNWYTNASLYPVLTRFEAILDNMEAGEYVDAELGIETIAFVEPTDIKRYETRADIDVVIQVKANGNILEFPIKTASTNSKSDLNSTSIGWVEYGGKLRPAFGFWRANALNVEVKCSCGNTIKANTGNVYCYKCSTRHDDVAVSMESNLDFVGDFQGWTFQTIPNLVVPTETLALVMALAQFDAGLPMDGLIEEDAE